MATNPFHQLDVIRKISREGKRVKDCYRLLYHKSLWIHVYKQLFQCKDNHWNQTKRAKMHSSYVRQIDEIIEDLKAGAFRFNSKQIYEQWKNKTGQIFHERIFKDQLALEMIKMLLQCIYAPIFTIKSHEMPQEKQIHHTLQTIRNNWDPCTWYIHGHMTIPPFKGIPRILRLSLSEKISDHRFLKLIHHAFNSGYLHYVYETSSSLKPQFEPNILYVFQSMYFHAFDLYMKELIQIETKKHFQSEKKTIQYRRCLDTYIVGLYSQKKHVIRLKEKLQRCLHETFEIQGQKIAVSHWRQKQIFLGYELKYVCTKPSEENHSRQRLQLNIPMCKLRQFVLQHEYGNLDTMHITHKTRLLNQSELSILRAYNQELKELASYYSLADNRSRLHRLFYMARCSFIRTLAHKRKSTYKKVMISLKKHKKGCLILQGYDSIGKEIHEPFIQLRDLQTNKD